MDLKRKLELTKNAVDLLVGHTSADKEVRLACLNEIDKYVLEGRARIEQEVKDKIASALNTDS